MKKSETRIKILFVYRYPSSFVRNDLEILQKYFDVMVVQHQENKKMAFLIDMLRGVQWADITFSWFAGWHAAFGVFFSKVFRKKSIVVVGGYDAAYVPEINYGAFTNIRRLPAKYVLKNADLLLPVSKFTRNELLEKVKPRGDLKIVYNGVDVEKFKPTHEKESNLVVTVAGISHSNLKRKGIETFVRTASLLPNFRFVVIGKFMDDSINYLKSIAPSNVEFTGFVSDDDLIKWYQKAKVVCQLSYYEAFGIAPAEGMASGCIPVVTKERAGLPEVVGNTGFYAPYGDEKATARAIKNALTSAEDIGEKARERIISHFSLKKREERLHDIITGLIEDRSGVNKSPYSLSVIPALL